VDDEPPARPVAGIPRLTDAERSLTYLAIRTIAPQAGADEETTADALDELAARGEVTIRVERHDVYLVAAGHVIVHAERAWLRAMSQSGNPRNN
jgi:hypothetical protein